MMRRLVAVLLIHLLFPIAQGVAQTPPSGDFLEQAGELQTKLRQWERVLPHVDIGSVRRTDAVQQVLSQDRSAALASVKLLDDEISELERKPTIEGRARVVLNLKHLQGSLANLSDFLRAAEMPNFGATRLDPWPQIDMEMIEQTQRFYEGLDYQLMKQFNAGLTVGPADAQNTPQTGQISGHVYRADTDRPLAGATVTLVTLMPPNIPVQLTQSAEDGSYQFSGLAPGTYLPNAYHAGFARTAYGFNKANGGWTPLTIPSGGRQNGIFHGPGGVSPLVAVGGKLDNIDLKLNPVPSVTQMDTQAMAAAYLDQRLSIQFQYGRFSPDGKLFAVTSGDADPQAVWFYDLASRRLTAVIPPRRDGSSLTSMGWAGDTLYAESTLQTVETKTFYSATVEGAKQISELPAAGEEALKEWLEVNAGAARNGRYVLTSGKAFRGPVTLTAQPVGGGETFTIAEGSWELGSYVFIPDRSLVLYPTSSYPAIALFDLDTRNSQETFLPVRAEKLLDAKQETDGFLVAYMTDGPCNNDGLGAANSFQPRYRPKNVCFTKVSLAVKK